MRGCMHSSSLPLVVEETGDVETIDDDSLNKDVTKFPRTNDGSHELVCRKTFTISFFHLGAIYGIYLMITSAKIYTVLFGKC